MTPLTKPVVRRTQYKVRGRELVVTIAPGSVSLRPLNTKESYNVDFETLWRWLETQDVHIK